MPNPTVLQVDLAAIHHNLDEARRLAEGRLVLAAVKADAYGHGIVEVSRSIERSGSADWLGVATVDEGLWLRQAGITLPILKFSPTLEDEEAAVAAGLTLGVGDEASIRRISVAGVAAGKTAEVHLKVDTGMHRFGTAVDDAPGLSRLIESLPNIALTGLFTHLPVSDVPDGEAFTHDQLERFRILADEIRRISSGEPVAITRDARFDDDCGKHKPGRPLAFAVRGGTFADRQRAKGACVNRDVGVGFNSVCCAP